MVFHCGFNSQVSNGLECGTSFHRMTCHLHIFFSEVSVQVTCWNFDWDCIEFTDRVSKNGHLDKMSFPIYEHGLPFQLLSFSFVSSPEFCSCPHIDLIQTFARFIPKYFILGVLI